MDIRKTYFVLIFMTNFNFLTISLCSSVKSGRSITVFFLFFFCNCMPTCIIASFIVICIRVL